MGKNEKSETDGLPVARATSVPTGAGLLDDRTLELLSRMDSFYIQQRIRFIEAATCNCIEQPNIYDVFDHSTNQRIMILKEESDGCSRCCCSPDHSVFVRFYHVDANAPELQPGQTVDWSYEPSGPPFMTFEREGCDCCCTSPGTCAKPCLCCFACTEGCSQVGTMHAGDLSGKAGEMKGKRERTKLIGESIQPRMGGGTIPIMQIMDRASSNDQSGQSEMFAATKGPCCFGGMGECCFNSTFSQATASNNDFGNVSKIKSLNFGDFATITKLKPKKMSQAMREFFTDSDVYDIVFKNSSITPQQKANILAHMVHLDYMFFERDNDMCYNDGNACHIVFFNCFCCGCVCPCECVISNNSGG